MEKEIKVTRCNLNDIDQDGFKPPAKFYFISALGDAVYIHCRDRADAEKYITDHYGKGFYKLRTSSIEKNKGDLTCTGSNTRRGFSPNLKGIRG